MSNETLELYIQGFWDFYVFVKTFIIPMVKGWWWAPLPFFLFPKATSSYLKWRQLKAFKEREYILLEIRLPDEIIKPVKAMEDVFTSMVQVAYEHAPGNTREKWIEGETIDFTTFSLEIISIEGEVRFFIRIDNYLRNIVESIFYSQYPDLEITEARDYTELVPQDIPNKEWDLEGMDWVLSKKDCYPIKTYEKFETGAEMKEGKRVDPMARLFESLSQLGKGHQLWLQFNLTAASPDWIKEGMAIRDSLVKRPKSTKPKPFIVEAIELLLLSPTEEKKKERVFPSEMMLTPGEREIVKAIENKISKQGFKTSIRMMYIGKRESFFKPNLGLPVSFLVSFGTENLNRFAVFAESRTKVKSLIQRWDKPRAFLKKRRMFRNYKLRVNARFPRQGGTSVFNTEEIASLFHFPGRETAPAPSLSRIKAKTEAPPPELPVGEKENE